MKKTILFFLLISMLGSCFAQESDHKFSAQIEIGPSIPLGRFAHKSFSGSPHDTSGNAMAGISADILLKYQLKKSFGISLLIGGTINKQDEEYLENETKKNGSDQLIVNVEADSWKVIKVMPGVYYTLPFSPNSKLSFTPMISMGICKTSVPGYSGSFYYPDITGSMNTFAISKGDLPVTFCYRASLALNYKINKSIFVLLDANYFGASPVLKYNYFPNWPQITTLTPAKKHYSLSSLNMFAGVEVRL